MNRYLLIVIAAVSFISCENTAVEKQKIADSVRREVILDDSLGVVTFDSPLRYDTSFAWMHYSDCNTCHEHKYRSQSKRNPIIKESGWMWEKPKDSVDRFTIIHRNYYFAVLGHDSIMDVRDHRYFKYELLRDDSLMKITFDSIYTINDREFSIIAIEKEDSLYQKLVFATTLINGDFVNFTSELITGNNDSTSRSFIKSSINLLNSIKITNGNFATRRTGKIPREGN